jgi:hypothetical protein
MSQMTSEEIEEGVQRWYKLCDEAPEDWDQTVNEYLGITLEEWETWMRTRNPKIETGIDIDTVDPQLTHVVIGVDHFDKRPLCGADTMWGYHHGTIKDVTCPNCIQRMK